MADKAEKKTRAKRSSMGFRLLNIIFNPAFSRAYVITKEGHFVECCEEKFKSLVEAEKFIKKNAEQFKDMTIMVAHFKKEIKISVQTAPVAKIEEVK